MSRQLYEIRYTRTALAHLGALERKYQRLLVELIGEQLSYEPVAQTRNRKPLQASALFGDETWELRLGPGNRFRVFYEMNEGEHAVEVLAIGVKDGSRLYLGGKEATP